MLCVLWPLAVLRWAFITISVRVVRAPVMSVRVGLLRVILLASLGLFADVVVLNLLLNGTRSLVRSAGRLVDG